MNAGIDVTHASVTCLIGMRFSQGSGIFSRLLPLVEGGFPVKILRRLILAADGCFANVRPLSHLSCESVFESSRGLVG